MIGGLEAPNRSTNSAYGGSEAVSVHNTHIWLVSVTLEIGLR